MSKRQIILTEIPRLRRFARGLCGNRDTADDLVQDCLERALAQLDSWKPGTNMRAWLFTILRNLYLNQLRSIARRPGEVPYDEHEEFVGSSPATQGQGLMIRDLQTALTMLPAQHREVILLIGVEGMNYKQAAEILDIPLGTVMSRLSRGRETLKALMDGDINNGRPALRRVK